MEQPSGVLEIDAEVVELEEEVASNELCDESAVD